MDLSKHHAITNNYQDTRLISLRNWKHAYEFQDRDDGGPYVVSQDGYDPGDFGYQQCEFILGKSGRWVALEIFFGLPRDLRRAEFIFPKASDVINLMSSLPSRVQVIRSGTELDALAADVPDTGSKIDELNRALVEAKENM